MGQELRLNGLATLTDELQRNSASGEVIRFDGLEQLPDTTALFLSKREPDEYGQAKLSLNGLATLSDEAADVLVSSSRVDPEI